MLYFKIFTFLNNLLAVYTYYDFVLHSVDEVSTVMGYRLDGLSSIHGNAGFFFSPQHPY
jgi:hypothetical protein